LTRCGAHPILEFMPGEAPPSHGSPNLLVHLGGLGDVCLSESTLLSLRRHFGHTLRVVGNKRILDLFCDYFTGVDSIERRSHAYLFTEAVPAPAWERIIFIGKDRSGAFRERMARLAGEVIFIDLYPDGRRVHVEEYQLEQLALQGIEPVKREVAVKTGRRVILYPERPYTKRKWPVERFLEIYGRLNALGVEVVLLGPPDLALSPLPAYAFENLSDIAAFFSMGAIFFSNDSGMAHFAARCGLRPFTLFPDADPLVWHPKGARLLPCRETFPTVEEVTAFILSGM